MYKHFDIFASFFASPSPVHIIDPCICARARPEHMNTIFKSHATAMPNTMYTLHSTRKYSHSCVYFAFSSSLSWCHFTPYSMPSLTLSFSPARCLCNHFAHFFYDDTPHSLILAAERHSLKGIRKQK